MFFVRSFFHAVVDLVALSLFCGMLLTWAAISQLL
jgi:hypothetical protein